MDPILAGLDIAEWSIKVGIPAVGGGLALSVIWLAKQLRETHRQEIGRLETAYEKQIDRLLQINVENHERVRALVEAIRARGGGS